MKKSKKSSIYQDLGQKLSEKIKKRWCTGKIELNQTIRRLRFQKGLSGVALCKLAGGLDPRTLTAIEKGRIRNPSIPVLQGLARGLGMQVSDLFRRSEIAADQLFYVGTQKGAYQLDFPHWHVRAVSFTPFNRNFFCGKFVLGARKMLDETMIPHPHPIFVSTLIGRFEVTLEGQRIVLREGDNLFFHGMLPHRFYNTLQREPSLLVVTSLE